MTAPAMAVKPIFRSMSRRQMQQTCDICRPAPLPGVAAVWTGPDQSFDFAIVITLLRQNKKPRSGSTPSHRRIFFCFAQECDHDRKNQKIDQDQSIQRPRQVAAQVANVTGLLAFGVVTFDRKIGFTAIAGAVISFDSESMRARVIFGYEKRLASQLFG